MGAERKWLFALFSAAFVSLLLFLSSISGFSASYYLVFSAQKPFSSTIRRGPGYPPAFAYYIYGGHGDKDRIFRLLLAVYHPRNRYLLHIAADGSEQERTKLLALVQSVPVIRTFGNVDVVGKADRSSYMGSSNIASVLRAAAILLKMDGGWDWFVNLNALDYPLLTQDDLSHVFSTVRRDLNFIDHTSNLGWKESQRIQPIVVDPALYLARRTQIFYATEKRPVPDAFKVFTGSPWFVLSRSFLEYCVLGWDNLPRTLLMYSNNLVLSQEVYFHSVICNSPEFKNTSVDRDLRFMVWDNPPKMQPVSLDSSYYEQMAQSGAAFARQFDKDNSVLDMIDEKVLKRGHNRATPGAWCTGQRSWLMDPCAQWGDINVLRLGPQAKKFEEYINNLLQESDSQMDKCR